MNKIVLYLILSFLISENLLSQYSCPIEKTAFKAGEELNFKITYNWLFIWSEVADASLKISSTTKFGQKALSLRGEGISNKSWELFLKAHDVYESWVDPITLQPIYFSRDIHENNFKLGIRYTYDFEELKAYSWSQKNANPVKLDTIEINPCTFDIMSIFYYSRTIDVEKLNVGDIIPFKIVLDREFIPLYFRFKGKETIKIKELGYVKCNLFSVMVVAGSVFKGGEDLFIWVTDDLNKIPVLAESPINVGKIKARLVSYKNTLYPMTSITPDK